MQQVQIEAAGRSLSLRRDSGGTWRDGSGTALPDLQGCTDIDISATPFTNTLPIRRLGLAPGQGAEIEVVYISVPDLAVRRSRQRYTNLGAGRYRYEALGSGFKADIAVDEGTGLVREYPDLFRCVAMV